MKRALKPKTKRLVTKHYGNGMMHHVGSPTDSPEKVEQFIKQTNFRGNYKGLVWVSVWKLEKEIEITREIK